MDYMFPAIFISSNDSGYTVEFPDLPGCITEGNDVNEAVTMAIDAMSGWILSSLEDNEEIPQPTNIKNIICQENEFVSLIPTNILDYKKKIDKKAVKKTLSIPGWLNNLAEDAHINFSKVLQEALKNKLKV